MPRAPRAIPPQPPAEPDELMELWSWGEAGAVDHARHPTPDAEEEGPETEEEGPETEEDGRETKQKPHRVNTLNELSGEEWLYFTKSVLTTAYPSELGHRLRRTHGANKPPRLMARLIEFFTKSGELVLDPFAGVGGTLLGAAISRRPRRAIGIEIESRWADIFAQVVSTASAERAGRGALLADLGPTDPGGPRSFDPTGLELKIGDAQALLPELETASIDFVATDPPYNIQLPITMVGGRLAEEHANRRSDYAMVTDDPADLANSPTYESYLDRMEAIFSELGRILRRDRYLALIVRDAYQKGRYIFTSADLAARATKVGLVLKGDLIWYQAGARLRPYGYPQVFVPNITHQHILVMRNEAKPRVRRRSVSQSTVSLK